MDFGSICRVLGKMLWEQKMNLKNVNWDIKQMIIGGVLGKGHSSAEPRGISMVELMKYVIHNQT